MPLCRACCASCIHRSGFIAIAVRDCECCCINKPYQDVQDRLLWGDATCLASRHELKRVLTIDIGV